MLGREHGDEGDDDAVRERVRDHERDVRASSATFPLFGCTHTITEPIHVAWLQKDGELHVQSERIAQTTSFACVGSIAQTCTSSLELHYANGAVQFQRPEWECTTQ